MFCRNSRLASLIVTAFRGTVDTIAPLTTVSRSFKRRIERRAREQLYVTLVSAGIPRILWQISLRPGYLCLCRAIDAFRPHERHLQRRAGG